MEQAPVSLRYQFRQRFSAALGGFTAAFMGALVLTFVVSRALLHPQSALSAITFGLLALGAFEVVRLGWDHMARSFARPQLLVDDDHVVIDDSRVMTGLQSISLDRIYSVYVGPGVGEWLVGAYAEGGNHEQTQLTRYPQLPNAVVVLDEPVFITRARARLLRLWHLSSPPDPRRATSAIWLTTEEADTFTLLMNNKGIETHWVPAGASFPGPSILDTPGWL